MASPRLRIEVDEADGFDPAGLHAVDRLDPLRLLVQLLAVLFEAAAPVPLVRVELPPLLLVELEEADLAGLLDDARNPTLLFLQNLPHVAGLLRPALGELLFGEVGELVA